MNFGGSRLGFWFRYPLGLPNRALSTKNVLVFYENNGQYYDVNPETDIWPVIQQQEIAMGMNPEFIIGYETLLHKDLSQYAHIWDIGYSSPYIPELSDPTNKLLSYVQSGGGFFLLGENSNFYTRDTTIDNFIGTAGGGTVLYEVNLDPYQFYQVQVESEFLIANQDQYITFDAPGLFASIGTGTPMTTHIPLVNFPDYPAVCWKTGSLANAPRGCIVSVLDVNFIVAGADQNLDFLNNIILTMNQR